MLKWKKMADITPIVVQIALDSAKEMVRFSAESSNVMLINFIAAIVYSWWFHKKTNRFMHRMQEWKSEMKVEEPKMIISLNLHVLT